MIKKIVVIVAMCICASAFARSHGGGHHGSHRGGYRPMTYHSGGYHHHHHSSHHGWSWGHAGRNFWPGFVGGIVGGAVYGGYRSYPSTVVYPSTTSYVASPVISTATTPYVLTPVVTTTPVITTAYQQKVWVPGRYTTTVVNGIVTNIWQPGHWEYQ